MIPKGELSLLFECHDLLVPLTELLYKQPAETLTAKIRNVNRDVIDTIEYYNIMKHRSLSRNHCDRKSDGLHNSRDQYYISYYANFRIDKKPVNGNLALLALFKTSEMKKRRHVHFHLFCESVVNKTMPYCAL